MWIQLWAVFQVNNHWVAFANPPTSYHTICSNGTRKQNILHKPTTLSSEPNCTIISTLFSLPSPPIQINTNAMFINNIFTDFLHPDIIANISKLILPSPSHFRKTTPLNDILHTANMLANQEVTEINYQKHASSHNVIFAVLTAAVTLILLSLLYCFLHAKCIKCARKQDQEQ